MEVEHADDAEAQVHTSSNRAEIPTSSGRNSGNTIAQGSWYAYGDKAAAENNKARNHWKISEKTISNPPAGNNLLY